MFHTEEELSEDRAPRTNSSRDFQHRQAVLRRALHCLTRARRFRRSGRTQLAEPQVVRCKRVLVEILAEEPENLSAHFLLTAALFEEGDFLGARQQAFWMLRRLSKRQQQLMQDPVLHLAIANASWRVGHSWDAMSVLLEASKAYPEHPQLCVAVSEILISLGYHSSAKDMSQLALMRNQSARCEAPLSARDSMRANCCFRLALTELGLPLEDGPQRPTPHTWEADLPRSMQLLKERLQRRPHASFDGVADATSPQDLPRKPSVDPGLEVLQAEHSSSWQFAENERPPCPSPLPPSTAVPSSRPLQPPASQAPAPVTLSRCSSREVSAGLPQQVCTPLFTAGYRKAPTFHRSHPVLSGSPWMDDVPWLEEYPPPSIGAKLASAKRGGYRSEYDELGSSSSQKQVIRDLDLMRGLLAPDRPKEASQSAVGPEVEGTAVNEADWCCRRDDKDQNGNRRPAPFIHRFLRFRELCRR